MPTIFEKVINFFDGTNGNNNSNNIVYGRQGLYQKALLNQFSSAKNKDVEINKAEIVSTIYTCVHILSSEVNRLPLSIKQTTDKVVSDYTGHKFYNTLRYSPQQFVKTGDWLTTVIANLCLRGNAYAYNDGGNLNLLDPDAMMVGQFNGELWYYNQETKQPIQAKNVLHFKLWGKQVMGKGLNPIESLRSELNIEYKAEKTVDSFFTNNAHSTKVLQTQPDMRTPNSKIGEMIKDFSDKFAGQDNAGNIIVVPPFYELKELQLNTNDVLFLEAARYSAAAIGALYGVPQYLLGKNDYAGKWEDASAYFRNNTIASLLNVITSELEYKLLTEEQRNAGASIEFDVNALLATSLIDRMNIYRSIAQNGGLTPQQFRTAFGLPYDPDHPELNEYVIQGQYKNLKNVVDGTATPDPAPTEPVLNYEQ